ncbi:MAG: SusC/RagA family TonB-linked outer membrane protein [Mucilaginibacter sp.]|uniref:SusC/RagA family TonB-linked outer membrane protein n=1 Tax=Mucilaginibacter sp. TaxID=1882438 RepID=UPI0031B3C330
MKKSLLFLFLVLCCWVTQTLAQTHTITGKITSAEDGLPLPGVSVKIVGATVGAVSDGQGNYSIKASSGQVISYSFIGTVSQQKTVGAATVINVALQADSKMLQEVKVTTGFGVQTQKRDLTSPVQIVKGEAIQQTQRENILNALQGRVAGASVTSTSGNPGASASIVLRGVNSIGGSNSPLFVVDGIRVSNDAVDQNSLASAGDNRREDFTNRIADFNPDDIESVTVLKGADAAAIYGSSASGGAIVITTKKGHNGPGTVTYDNDFGFATAYRFPKIQDVYGVGQNGASSGIVRTLFGPAYAPGTKTYNNLQNIMQTGHTTINNLALEGGNETTTYRLSAAVRDATGVLPVAYNDKISLRFSGTSKISSKLTSSASFNYFNIDNRKLNKGNSGTYINALAWPTNDDVRNYLNPDGTRRLILPASVSNITSDATVDFDNPLWDAHNNISRDKTNRAVGNIDLSFDATSWLNLRALAGIDYAGTSGNNFVSQYSSSYQNSPLNSFAATSGIATGGIIDNYTDNNLQINGSFFATGKKQFGDFRTTLAVGAEAISNQDEINGFYGEKFIQPDFNNINNTTPTTQRSSDYVKKVRYLSGIARLGLVYKEMLTLNATAREEYSSKLSGTRQDHYFYPSVGAGFIFTELPGLKNNSFLSYGKIRASYAEVGKDPAAPYKIFSTLLQQTTTGGGFAYDVTGNNPNLRPERDKELDLGAELQFFNGRLGADISYYQVKATNQIFNPRISYASGYVLEYLNGGEVKNHGIEVSLTAIPVKSKDFNWDVLLNFTAARGKVISLGGLPEYYNSDTWIYSNVRSSIFPGSSTTNIAAYGYSRNNKGQVLIDPSSGLPISNVTFGVAGDRQPTYSIGLGNHFSYKSFDLNFLFDIRKGGDIFNGNELFMTKYGLSERTLNRMTPVVVPGVLKDGNENSANPTPNNIQVTPNTQNNYYVNSIDADFIEHDINWVRLKDVTLSYRLPQSLLSRQKVLKSASIFVTATDVFLITNYSGADPDVSGTNASTLGTGAAGFDYGTVPTPRVISLGLRVKL